MAAPTGGFEGVPSEATSEIKHPVDGAYPQAVEVDGEHQAPRPTTPAAAGGSVETGRSPVLDVGGEHPMRRAPGWWGARQHGLVALGGAFGRHLPRETIEDPAPAGRPEGGPQDVVVEQASDRSCQRSRIVGRHEQGSLTVDADHLGQGAPRGGYHGDPARHRLDGGQREPLVQRRHHRRLRLAVETGEVVVADTAHAPHRLGQPETGDRAVDAPSRLGLADHHELDVPLVPQDRHRFEQRD